MATILTLRCASCGAPLKVPTNIDRFACKHCGNEQQVVHEGDTVVLKKGIEAIQDSTARVASELAIKRLEKEMETPNYLVRTFKDALALNKRELETLGTPQLGQVPPPPAWDFNRYVGNYGYFGPACSFFFWITGICWVAVWLLGVIFNYGGVFAVLLLVGGPLLGIYLGFFKPIAEGRRKHTRDVENHANEWSRLTHSAFEESKNKIEKLKVDIRTLEEELRTWQPKYDELKKQMDHHQSVVRGH